MKYSGICYRGVEPKWAHVPGSGMGAAVRGARFNPAGVETLYLALTLDGINVELKHGFEKFAPVTLCSYDVDVEDIVDLSTPAARRAQGVSLRDMRCAWLADLASGRRPRSWDVAERFRTAGAAGILVPSFATGAKRRHKNLVLWIWGPDLPRRVVVHDPSGRLPRDQSSWP